MRESEERIEALVVRGQLQRRALAFEVDEIRAEIVRRRTQWRVAAFVAGGLAAAGTAAYKLFGRGSLAAKVGRFSSTASLLLGLGRAAIRLRRFI